MRATKVVPPQVRARADDPIIEAMAVRGLLFGLLMVAPFWFLIAVLALASS